MPRKTASSAKEESSGAEDDLEGLDFEAAIEELESLVDEMETGDLSLEASLVAYERGVKLTRFCQTALRNAELKVNQLTKDGELEPLDSDAFDDD